MRQDTDYQQIMDLHLAWIDAELRGDIPSILRMCSDDIRFYPPDSRTIEGKNAVSIQLQSDQETIERVTTFGLVIDVSGNLAYKTASFITHVRSGSESDPAIHEGNHIWVLRRQDSDWRVIIVAWSLIK